MKTVLNRIGFDFMVDNSAFYVEWIYIGAETISGKNWKTCYSVQVDCYERDIRERWSATARIPNKTSSIYFINKAIENIKQDT